MQQFTYALGIDPSLSSICHPWPNPTERLSKDFNQQLDIIVGQNHIERGQTPTYLVFVRELRTTYDVYQDLTEILDAGNFVAQFIPYLRTSSKALRTGNVTFDKEHDRKKKYADQHR